MACLIGVNKKVKVWAPSLNFKPIVKITKPHPILMVVYAKISHGDKDLQKTWRSVMTERLLYPVIHSPCFNSSSVTVLRPNSLEKTSGDAMLWKIYKASISDDRRIVCLWPSLVLALSSVSLSLSQLTSLANLVIKPALVTRMVWLLSFLLALNTPSLKHFSSFSR